MSTLQLTLHALYASIWQEEGGGRGGSWVCPNAKCKAVNNTGKPKLLECRLCAEPRPLATTLWALEDYRGPGLAEAKRMMAKGSRVKGAGKGAPGAPPVSQASKGASKGDNPKGKGKGDHKPPQKPPATPATPQVSKEALAILKETGHDTNKKATEDTEIDSGQFSSAIVGSMLSKIAL